MLTERLEIRPPQESDRQRLVQLFTDQDFMIYNGVKTPDEANARFDEMRALFPQLPFAKQPIIERESGLLIGYAGVAWFDLHGETALEFGYRLTKETRGKGYATEAGKALLQLARETFSGTIYLMVDPTNQPSIRVAEKLGFTFKENRETQASRDLLYKIELH